MQQRITNNAGLDLAAAVWLATDEYTYDTRPNYISVTTLIKPIRQTVLARRVPLEERTVDLLDRVKSSIGHVLHRGIEHSWKEHYRSSLAKLGFPKRVIDAVRINPEEIEPDTIPVFTEFRSEKEVAGFIVSGQVDLIIDWRLRDAKSTTVWAYQSQKSVEGWKLQGSIYRWLNPEKVTHDELLIQYLLLDWSSAESKRTPGYPPHAVPVRSITLMSVQETDQWIRNRLSLLKQYMDAPDHEIPECNEDELWRSEPVYKYYANVNATGRSTKNFDNALAARQFMAEKGGKGRVDMVPGTVKACLYCAAFSVCKQKDRLIADGSLLI
ncbi:hypothetical protein [Dyella sp. ASV21]|uniref:hypothetical protein n=1 Tax=Dyella sp. ASV21 TaxID=2795114 RepID=UPI0018EA8F86|nr:hypothetical protein [Dyella sp. ASV21]